MSITRTPRPTVPDTRRAAYGNVLRPTDVGRPWSHRALELRARARRANLIVSTREEPKRPDPTTTLWAASRAHDLPARRCASEVFGYQPSGQVIVPIAGVLCVRQRAEIQVVTRW